MRRDLEARGGIEPPIKVLQTFALPLGDRASEANLFYHFTVGQPLLAVHFRRVAIAGDGRGQPRVAVLRRQIEGGDVSPPSMLPD